MSESDLRQLAKRLTGRELRIRTGILEIPPAAMGAEDDVAVRLGGTCLDMSFWELDRIPSDQRLFPLSAGDLANHIRDATQALPPGNGCVLLCNLDLLVARIEAAHRSVFWGYLRETFKFPRGILVIVPAGAGHLLAVSEREKWVQEKRLASWEGTADDGSDW